MNSILICGSHSFVGNGLSKYLRDKGNSVNEFSRGKEERKGKLISGNYLKINKNKCIIGNYDVVINFAVLKDCTCNENIQYIQALVDLCKKHAVKKLIHFSTIMNYNYHIKDIDEHTSIETLEETDKKGYAEIKIAVDQYLMKVKENLPFEVVFVRPGYVLAENRPCPFIKHLPLGFIVIKGNKNSRQPIVRREDIHVALLKIIENEKNNEVYHFFPNNGMTKYRYAKALTHGIILTMPKWLFKGIPYVMMKCHLVSPALYSRFDGMYIESNFSSKETEEKLNMKFR